jgi:ubiquinone/menaquinone biosynthesis C-methylase UbiE
MNKAEFDKFADEYHNLHSQSIRTSGENPEFFAEYKIIDVKQLVAQLGMGPDLRILDFGAGIGNSVPFFAKHLPNAHLTCVDVSQKSLQIAMERFPAMADYEVFDGNVLPFSDGCFSLVFTACVFHHIPATEHEWLFREIHRVLSPGGIFIVFEHNPRNPLTVRAVDSCPFDEDAVLISAETLQARIRIAGFEAVKSKYRIFFPGFLRPLRLIEPLLGWLPLGAQYYVIGRKLEVH